ncbi:hypothetical protein P4O66_001283 [Electrophorus voltai]|uniref:Uncharacterized protein n=1 Tax=Electrophorus voltai TaxID=2609070 RepID=A0AAD8ZAQ6_9TELE|nr:hypothetical protein P4O66_001283 [Electrophorus voltai]
MPFPLLRRSEAGRTPEGLKVPGRAGGPGIVRRVSEQKRVPTEACRDLESAAAFSIKPWWPCSTSQLISLPRLLQKEEASLYRPLRKRKSYTAGQGSRGAGRVAEGVCEIWLTSEDTGAYGRDIGVTLPSLLWALVREVPEGCMLRVGMTNPPYILEHLETMCARLLCVLDCTMCARLLCVLDCVLCVLDCAVSVLLGCVRERVLGCERERVLGCVRVSCVSTSSPPLAPLPGSSHVVPSVCSSGCLPSPHSCLILLTPENSFLRLYLDRLLIGRWHESPE